MQGGFFGVSPSGGEVGGAGAALPGMGGLRQDAAATAGRSAVHQRPRVLQGIDIGGGLVAADGVDAGEAHGEAGVVALRGLDRVEGDFEDEVRLDVVFAALLRQGVALEVDGEFLDLGIGEAGVGLADDAELAAGFITDGEGVVGEDFGAFAVALLGGDDDAVEGAGGLEFQPGLAAATGGVGAGGVFRDQAFMAVAAGLLEGGLDGFAAGGAEHGDEADGG